MVISIPRVLVKKLNKVKEKKIKLIIYFLWI
jgi:hypothetical protein